MTSEDSADERSESAEERAGSEAPREQSEPEATGSSEKSSGEPAPDQREGAQERAGSTATREQSDPRDNEESGGGERSDTDDVPLDITGHEERKQERESGDQQDRETDAKQNGDTPIDGEALVEDAPVDPRADPDDDEVEPVEVLVQLAKRGDIEPWDIDIVAVTDKFLEALDEADLRTSGRALFYASVLLRMKSDAMLEDDDEEEQADAADDRPPWEAPPAEGGAGGPAFDPVNALESEMERRLDRKHARGNPETLEELVRELREAERGSWWKESREYDTSDSPKGFRRGVQELDYHAGDDFRMDDEPTQAEALGTAHDEDIDATIEAVRAALHEQYAAGRTEVLYAEISHTGPSRVETFLALLFLAHRGAVTLEQDDLFGDLWVCDERVTEVEAPAAAD